MNNFYVQRTAIISIWKNPYLYKEEGNTPNDTEIFQIFFQSFTNGPESHCNKLHAVLR